MRWPDSRKKSSEFPRYYSLPHPAHGVKVIGQIVDGIQRLRHQFVRSVEVPQIGPRVAGANLAPAVGIEWAFVPGESRVLDRQAPLGGEQQTMTRRPRRQYAVHHVHA